MLPICAAIFMTIVAMKLWQNQCPERRRENKAAIKRWAQLVDRLSAQQEAIQHALEKNDYHREVEAGLRR